MLTFTNSFVMQRLNLLQEITGHMLQHLHEVADGIGAFRFPAKEQTCCSSRLSDVSHLIKQTDIFSPEIVNVTRL